MSCIQEVQLAEKKLQAVLRELKKTDLTSRNDLHQQLAEVTDEYVKAIADLRIDPILTKHRKAHLGGAPVSELLRGLSFWRVLALLRQLRAR